MRAAPASSLSRRSRFSPQLALEMLARQVGRDARQHLFALDRLGDVVDRAELEARHLVRHFAARRQEDHERVARLRLRLQFAADLEAVHARHHHVEQHQVRLRPPRDLERGRAVLRREDAMAACHAACAPAPAGSWRCRRRRESSTAASRCQRASPLPLAIRTAPSSSSDAASSRTPSKSKLAASALMRRPGRHRPHRRRRACRRARGDR